eukprot:TRINITY_DN2290_c0_g1_i1.p1 TRINITY_DN2290_c0_g1~~TRINITY_DN2290_c0_g1_i1.p1  ORF type:complete len:509 (+),score=145.17 TRINITY_DN2290_c0_g1_i1:46-1527(+)
MSGVTLNRSNLSALPPKVHVASYGGSIVPGIAHIGVGAFHRAHQAVYLDRVLEKTKSNEWGLVGIGLLPFDIPMRDACQKQDCLYTVNELAPDGSREIRVIQSMVEYLYAPDNIKLVLERLSQPSIRIVSLTITEGGYLIDPKGNFLLNHPSVTADLANANLPASTFGIITEALRLRKEAGIKPFTVMSCDNLRHNGDQAKKACLAFARARDPQLADWIQEHVTFPNGMVDRITPATTPDIRSSLNASSGVDDLIPVICEDFIQWVLEDKFCAGRPQFELAGVTITDNVTPYEEAKIRLLNGSHQMLSYPAFLAGLRRVDDAMADPLFMKYLRDFLNEDSGPFLKDIPGMEIDKYKEILLQRFGNVAIGDQLARLCLDGGSKIPGFLLPTIRANLEKSGNTPRMAFLLACYWHYIHSNQDDLGNEYQIKEPNAMDILQPIIDSSDPLDLLRCHQLLGDSAEFPKFSETFVKFLGEIQNRGIRKTLEDYPRLAQ